MSRASIEAPVEPEPISNECRRSSRPSPCPPPSASGLRACVRLLGHRAIGFEPQRPSESRYFDQLRTAGAIVEVRPGKYRGDRAKWDAIDREYRNRLLTILSAAVAIGGALIALAFL